STKLCGSANSRRRRSSFKDVRTPGSSSLSSPFSIKILITSTCLATTIPIISCCIAKSAAFVIFRGGICIVQPDTLILLLPLLFILLIVTHFALGRSVERFTFTSRTSPHLVWGTPVDFLFLLIDCLIFFHFFLLSKSR
ncbi:hypothetical protein PENTCL1PPCAC_3359, partial [Pristionchus entomophagus]